MDWMLYSLTALSAILIGYIVGQRKVRTQRHAIFKHLTVDLSSPPNTTSNIDYDSLNNISSEEALNADDNREPPPDEESATPFLSTPGLAIRASSSIQNRRIVIVAKQLPLRTIKQADGTWKLEWDDARNFLSGLSQLREICDVKFVGSPNSNVDISKEEQDDYESMLYEHDCIPVFLPKPLSERFFNGFCKNVLWPMLHYVLPSSDSRFGQMWDEEWQSYTAANTLYASVVSHCVESPTDMVWVQNYHLLLLPSFLRTKLPRAKIGLFIHTPFTSSDVFRILPARHNILSSIMASDLIGFHTFDYARHFLSCIKRVMDLDFETMPGGTLGVKFNGRFVSILISHVGIDSQVFSNLSTKEPVLKRVEELKHEHEGRQIICGVDELDVVKGPMLKLQAIHHFFTARPEWRDKCTFIQVFMQSTGKCESLDTIREEINRMKLEFGNECIHLIECRDSLSLPLGELVALFRSSDVAVVSAVADGLNVRPFEFTACQDPESPGALVISEAMGCSRALNRVSRVNPFNFEQITEAIHNCLSSTREERIADHLRRHNYVMNHTIMRWASGFLEQLDRATRFSTGLNYVQVGWGSNVKLVGVRSDFAHLDEDSLTAQYRKAAKRILLLDYDGTLTPAEKNQHKSSLVGPTPAIKKLLKLLTDDEDNVVFIMSGRTRATLTMWFSDIPELGLAAEKGLFLYWPKRLQAKCRMDDFQPDQFEAFEKLRDEKIAALQSQHVQQNVNASPTSISSPDSDFSDEEQMKSRQTVGDAHLLREHTANDIVNEAAWECLIPLSDLTWKPIAIGLMKSYCEATDGSWIEDKEFALVWHYEDADPEYGRMQASELSKYLHKVLANPSLDIVKYDYNRILEVKPHGISKGRAATVIAESLLNKPGSFSSSTATPNYSTLFKSSSYANLNYRLSGSKPSSVTNSPHSTSPISKSPLQTPVISSEPFFLVCGDDRSDESMFLAIQNKDYVHGRFRSPLDFHHTLKRAASNADRRSIANSPVKRTRLQSDDSTDGMTAPKKKKNTQPNIFTVCVGMKPSSAHYYLHDDEEVIKMLVALATCTQRMAQTRQADNANLRQMPVSIDAMNRVTVGGRTQTTPEAFYSSENEATPLQTGIRQPFQPSNSELAPMPLFFESSNQRHFSTTAKSSFIDPNTKSKIKTVHYAEQEVQYAENVFSSESEAEVEYGSGSDEEV